jgi:helix-turn-helix protein
VSLRTGGKSQRIAFSDILDVTVGPPPERFADVFDKVFGIKFSDSSGTPKSCFIDYTPQHAELFEYQIFANIINGSSGVAKLGAVRGGQQTNASTGRVAVAVDTDRVAFKLASGAIKEISLGDIVNIQTGSRTVGGEKRRVVTVNHMEEQTRVTSYLSLLKERPQNLLNRYLRREYSKLKQELQAVEISEAETELVIGYYTTHDIEQTMQTLTSGDKYRFESIYEDALNHGLVTDPDSGIVGLTQKGRMLANLELEAVNQ